MSWELEEMTLGEARDHFSKSKVKWPPWLYAVFFFIPALVAFVLMRFSLDLVAPPVLTRTLGQLSVVESLA